LIPRFPLEPGASYTASVTLNLTARAPDTIVTDDSNGGDTVIPGTNYSGNYTKTWTFKTAAANPSTDLAFKQGGIVCKPKPGADADCHKATRKDLLDAGLLAEVGLGKGKRKGSKLAVPLTASKALVGKKATLNLKVLSFRGSKNLRASTLTLRPTQTLSLPAPPRGSVLVVTVQAGPAGVVKSFR
jgi:hypothetical protein